MNKLIPFIILIALIACEKEQTFTPVYQKCKLLKEIQMYSFNDYDSLYPYYENVYENNRLVKRYLHAKFTVLSFTTAPYSLLSKELIDSIIYDSEGKVFELFHYTDNEYSNLTHERYYYTGDKISKIKFITYDLWKSINSYGEETFQYSDNGQLTESTKTTFDNIIKFEKKNYSYNNQNLSRIDITTKYKMDTNYYSLLHVDSSEVYTSNELFDNYDDMSNPYKGLFYIQDYRIKSLSENNYQYYEYDYHDLFSDSHRIIYDTIHEYNVNEYPTKIGYYKLEYECD